MDTYVATCACGHKIKVPYFALGMKGKCPRCGGVFTPDESQAVPMDQPQEQPPAAPEPAGQRPPENVNADTPQTTCARCGNPFRGDWDRQETQHGVYCYRCSNQATDGVPERLKHLAQAPPTGPLMPKFEEEQLKFTEKPAFKRGLLIAGLLVVALAIYYSPMANAPVPASSRTTISADAEAIEMPTWVAVVWAVWRVLGIYLGLFLTLYIVLNSQNRLPHEVFWENLVYLSWVLLLLTAVSAGIYAALWVLDGTTITGMLWERIIWRFLIASLGAFAAIFILMRTLDFGIKDFALSFLYFALVEIIIQTLGMGIAAGLYSIAT